MKDKADKRTLDVIENGLKLGYARVSTDDQELLLQTDALNAAGCVEIYSDKMTGRKKEEREGLMNVLKALRPGDTLVIWRLDRLGRSLQHLVEIINDLNHRNIRLEIIKEGIDTRTANGRMIAGIFGALAEYQANLIRENTIAGLRAAKRQGRVGGKKPKLNDTQKKQAAMLLMEGANVSEVAETFKVSRPTLYRHLDIAQIKEDRLKKLAKELSDG